jgi:hypothetical protein
VLTCHPAAADPAARPNWGAVALVPADAEPADLDAELRGAVSRARALAEEAACATQSDEPETSDPMSNYASPTANGEIAPAVATYVADAPAAAELSTEVHPASAEEAHDDSAGANLNAELEIPEGAATYLLDESRPSSFSGQDEVIRAATDALVARTGFSRADALRMMEQEAADLNQSIEAVARAVLGDDALEPADSQVPAAA